MGISDWSSDVCSSDLRSLAEGLDRRLYGIWNEATRRERAMLQKLKEAYAKARYSKHYRISEDELAWLSERVEELGRTVHTICSERIGQHERSAERRVGKECVTTSRSR